MNRDGLGAMLLSWEVSLSVTTALLVAGMVYVRGWLILRRRGASHFTIRHLASYFCGLATISVALQSPLEVFAGFSLQVHMVQHLLLIIVAPPLILQAAPQLPILTGLPIWLLDWLGPFARWQRLQAFFSRLVHPATTWIVFVVTLWLWHSPFMYELALRNPFWHRLEHAALLIGAMLFWWPIIQPYPSRPAAERWWLIPYLFLAGVQGTALAGLITFSDRVLYANYDAVPNLWGLTALQDQRLAGALMWVPMSVAFLIPLLWVVGRQMSSSPPSNNRRRFANGSVGLATENRTKDSRNISLPILPVSSSAHAAGRGSGGTRSHRRTRETVFGKILKMRFVRQTIRILLLLLTVIIVIDGFTGPQVAGVNLAGVAPWIHWRGILVITILVGGNFFCMACPFTAFRRFARRLFSPSRHWPRRLRTKWLAVGILILFFWAYESFSLWDRPACTAAIVVGFFVVAFSFDSLFVNAPFCKFVCPIGQFNFVQSLVSPSEVSVVSTAVCASCQTRDCIAGNEQANGCSMLLFLPRKSGNMDCTFCFDCADACPKGNVSLISIGPGSDLTGDPQRSGVGRYSRRPDIAALIIVLLFASLINAAWMTAPFVEWESELTRLLGINRIGLVGLGMTLGLCILPFAITGVVARLSDWAGKAQLGYLSNLTRFAPALAPLGFGMWLAHFLFHLFTSGDAILVATKRGVHDWIGSGFAVAPTSCCCCDPCAVNWLLPLELLMLGFGLCVSLCVIYRRAQAVVPVRLWIRQAVPWFAFAIVFYALCVWVLFQPMQMRGVSM